MTTTDPVALASRLICGGGQNILGLNFAQQGEGGDNNDDSRSDGGSITNPDGSPVETESRSEEEQRKRYQEAVQRNIAAGASKLV